MLSISYLRPVVLGEADVALHHVVHIGYAVAQHQDPLDPQTEGEALVFLGVDADGAQHGGIDHAAPAHLDPTRDRKSTRLNSSHVASSYAVFCLKKKMRD